MGAANTGGTGDTKSVTKKKSEEDTEVSAYEKEFAKKLAEKKEEANVEIGLGTPTIPADYDPEKDDTAAIQAIKDSKKTPTTNIGNGGNDGGNNNTPPPTILKKTAGGQTVQTTAPTEAELSQSAAADAEAYDLRKTKKKGRSMTILTSSKGLDDKYTLGKPSLLGA